MEIDRVSAMGAVGHDADPAWQRPPNRRRKFVAEIPEPASDDDLLDVEADSISEPEAEPESGAPESEAGAPEPESSGAEPAESRSSFRAIA